MRSASDNGLWVVQNPRSNRGNGVGYPSALDSARKIALGTDGFPSRMSDEVVALREEAIAHGESEHEVERRIAGGSSLIRELFGQIDDEVVQIDGRLVSMKVGTRPVVTDGRLVAADIEEIRARASEAAAQLWKRMAVVP